MKVSFAAWKRDGTLFSTSRFRGEPDLQCMRRTIPGIAEALKLMVQGEERRIWVPKHLAFQGGDDDDDPKPPDIDLTFDVELVELIKAPPTPTDLKAPPKTAKKTKTGLVYQVLKKSESKQRPSVDRRVKVRYTGWFPDGTLFESTELSGRPAEFSFGDMLAGWKEGLALMVVGEKTRFWVPANLAYGEKPRRRGMPSGNLIYDIELIEIL
jgi:peptidylprolyl isomerase